jgi:LytS/YehU family sensor histidine kinase
MFYSAASTVFISVDSEMRNAKLQILVRDSQLNQLHAQLNPHFLFNTLNSIQQAMFEAPGTAKEMLEGLKNLLNTTAKYEGVHEITLAEELDVVQNYVSIQKIRYEHRLRVNLNVAAELLRYKVLPMVIQTLVENAIKHNINRTHKGIVVDIVVTKLDTHLVISIVNDGELKTIEKMQGQGAVNNIRRRLALLYGSNGTLTLQNLNCKPERVEACLTMPLIV